MEFRCLVVPQNYGNFIIAQPETGRVRGEIDSSRPLHGYNVTYTIKTDDVVTLFLSLPFSTSILASSRPE